MAKYLDVIWPMQYPSHWARQGRKAFGTGHPETIPRKIYEATTRRLIDQIGERAHDVEIRPWIQVFEIASFGGVRLEQPRRGELGSYVLKQRAGLMRGDANGYALWGSVASQREVFQVLRIPGPDASGISNEAYSPADAP